MKNIILLDLDGILITTPPWKPDILHQDGYSDFNEKNILCFNQLLSQADAELWLSSSRRKTKTLEEFDQIFKNRKIISKIKGFLPIPENPKNRFQEINDFLAHHDISNFLIIDDDHSLNQLNADSKKFWIKTAPLIGFNQDKLAEALWAIEKWKR